MKTKKKIQRKRQTFSKWLKPIDTNTDYAGDSILYSLEPLTSRFADGFLSDLKVHSAFYFCQILV